MIWVRFLAACAGLVAVLLSSLPATAGGVDGAGNDVVVPLVFAGPGRSSTITVTNAGPHPIVVTALYVGAEGTPLAASRIGSIFCGQEPLDAGHSRTFAVGHWCRPLDRPDVENFGYLRLTSEGDAVINFSATSTTRTVDGAIFDVPGQPVGAFDTGRPPLNHPLVPSRLSVGGLRSDHAASGTQLACYVASLEEPKEVELSLLDGSGRVLGTAPRVTLDAERMVRLAGLPAFGVTPVFLRNARVVVSATSTFPGSLVVAGCALENPLDGTLAYQAARTPDPGDESRLQWAYAHTGVHVGPYRVGYIWTHTLLGSAASTKVTLSTDLRPDDRVRCELSTPPKGGFDPRPWLELQVRDPDGAVAAGGNRASDTGVFSTGPRGRYRDQRWHVDVSYNEDAHAQSPWPRNEPPGVWAVICQSAAGMSALLTVDDPTATDDF